MIHPQVLIATYWAGWDDQANGEEHREYETPALTKAYQLGRDHYLSGEDIGEDGYLSGAEIVKAILRT